MRIICVGLGPRGRSWIEVCRRNPQVELAAYVEIDNATMKQAQERFDLPAERLFGVLDAALGSVEADAVLDTTPPAAHEGVATTAFGAALHVLQEKPMSDDFAAARRMVAAAEHAGRAFMVTQNYRRTVSPSTSQAGGWPRITPRDARWDDNPRGTATCGSRAPEAA
jgi:predicted dehydrogenase